MGQKEMAMIYGPKTERILAGVLTVASGGWIILILLGHLESLGWGQVLGLFVLFGIGVASLITQIWFRRLGQKIADMGLLPRAAEVGRT